jgi:large repetitive protein
MKGKPRMHAAKFHGLTILILCVSGTARGEGIDTISFKPSLSSTGHFAVESPRVLDHLTLNAGLIFDYGNQLLMARDPDTHAVLSDGVLVDDRLTAHLTVALGLWDRAEIGFRLPAVLYQSGSLAALGGSGQISSTVLGDIAVGAKVRLLGSGGSGPGFRLAALLAMSAPAGSSKDFASSGSVSVRPGLVAGLDMGIFSSSLILGYHVRGKSQVGDLTVNDEIEFGLATAVALVPDEFWLQAEVFGRRGVQAQGAERETPIELDAGPRIAIYGPWLAQVGIGTGLSQGYGTPKLRGIVALAYAPPHARPLAAPSSIPALAPARGDADGDGIPDAVDRCPGVAEDKDQFQDEDGCPDLDNDGDGVPDVGDSCPNEPEDRDGVQDQDGCPDLDNDMDGIPDAKDKCPDHAEDRDGFQDDDGCPDLDNDQDGIPDAKDKCPNEAEVYNGNADDDGCPDAGAALVELTKEKLIIKQEVKFETARAKVKADSFQLLATVAKLLTLHPEIASVRVEGHTDAKGKRAKNMKLSQARAEAVRQHLVEVNGIEADRLQAVGYGPDRPVASNSGKQGRAQNRRVEFVILSP